MSSDVVSIDLISRSARFHPGCAGEGAEETSYVSFAAARAIADPTV